MKRIFWGFAALSLLALPTTSCDNETVETKGDGEKYLSYGVASGKQTLGATRVKETVLGDLQENGFDVVVSGTSTGFPATYTLSYSATEVAPFGNWSYNSGIPVLHPEETLTHYAAYPLDLTEAELVGGVAEFEYAASGNDDLIFASAETTNDSQDAATADLTFEHLLSQVNFAVKSPETGADGIEYTVTINSIEMDVNSTDTYNAENGWSGTVTTPETYIYNVNGGAGNVSTDGELVYLGNGGGEYGYDNALMLMPQTPGAGAGSFTFNYTLTSSDGFEQTETITVNFSDLEVATEWAAGYRYVYVINFETPVYIKYNVVDVTAWEDDDDIDVDADNNGNNEEIVTP